MQDRTVSHACRRKQAEVGLTLSLTCGFAAAELPIGLKIAARPHGEAVLLSAARLLEQVLDVTPRAPIDPRPAAATG